MKRIATLLLLLNLAAAPATTRVARERADVAAPKTGPTTRIVERFHELHEKYVQRSREGNVDILFLGDSITEGWNYNGKEVWEDRFAPHNAANFGISGDRTQHLLWRITNGELEGIKPKVTVLMIGTNNIPMNGEADPPAQIAAGIERIVAAIRRETRGNVLLLGIFPRGASAESSREVRAAIAEVNARIAKLDDGRTVRYLDLSDKFMQPDKSISKEIMPDFLHLSPRGYQIWADSIESLLREMIESPEPGSPTTQRATDPTPKFEMTGEPQAMFMSRHQKFLDRAREGNIDLLFIGDSITQGWSDNEHWQKYYTPRNAANFGIGGDRTQHVLWRITNGELDGLRPKVVVIMIGTNNVKWNPPDQIAAAIEKIVRITREKTSAKVLLLGIFTRGWDDRNPRRATIRQVNQMIARLDDGQNVRFLDIGHKFYEPDGVTITRDTMPDGTHLSLKAYRIWAESIEPLLSEMMGD